jgi:agmatine deiminase
VDRLKTRYPAEWETHRRTWLAWPHNAENWAHRPAIRDFYISLLKLIRKFEPSALLVPGEMISTVKDSLKSTGNHPLEIFDIETDDIWIRDYGPLFVEKDGAPHVVSFEFNAWGKKFPPWEADNQVPGRIAKALGISISSHTPIFEGGAIEINGEGAGITTLDCLIGLNRNAANDRETVEAELKAALGLHSLMVLGRGLNGDHTDGHIDNVARFVAADHIVVAREDDPSSPNHRILSDAKERLAVWHPNGRPLTISTLPLPPQRTVEQETLPASYMNFIFVNGGLIVPTYRSPDDEEALAFFRKVFLTREVIGIDCTLVIEEGGSLHCLSKQEPLFG